MNEQKILPTGTDPGKQVNNPWEGVEAGKTKKDKERQRYLLNRWYRISISKKEDNQGYN